MKGLIMFDLRPKHFGVAASLLLCAVTVGAGITSGAPGPPPPPPPVKDAISGQDFPDESGTFSTISTTGKVDQTNPFFQSLGSNGRACVNCHQPKSGWTITDSSAQVVFDATNGLDPLFRPVDGAVSPNADVSTVAARRIAYAMLLNKGLIRVHLPIPSNAEFTLKAVDDPYHYASAADLSLFRRPLPTTNLSFLNVVMWDGRQTADGKSIFEDLQAQALDAIQTHAQAMTGQTISPETLRSIARFETTLYTAQTSDLSAGRLDQMGAQGGPRLLLTQPYYPGINDPLGLNPTQAPFDPRVFQMYSAWSSAPIPPIRRVPTLADVTPTMVAARASIARGEEIFNTKTFLITGVAGLNDVYGKPVIRGTCSTCHDTPNVGNHSVPLVMNTGIADGSLRTPDMPLYTLENNATGETVQTTDPGRALITGRWDDIGKFKVPSLRGLETRSPYFHNGFTDSLDDAVGFYDTRFHIGFTPQEKADLVAFLPTL